MDATSRRWCHATGHFTSRGARWRPAPSLPRACWQEIFPRVVAYWAHAGDYFSAAVVDAAQIAEADAALADAIRRLRRAKSKLPSSRAAALEGVIAQLARV